MKKDPDNLASACGGVWYPELFDQEGRYPENI